MARGRTIASMGQAFSPWTTDHSTGGEVTQSTYRRTWGIPTGPGWFVGPGKWNVFIPPILVGLLSKLIEITIKKV